MRIGILAIVLCTSTCGPAPESKLGQVARSPSPASPPALEPEGVTVEALPAPSISAEQESAPAREAPATPPAKWQAYTEAYRAVLQAPPPQIFRGADGIPDPNSINASLNDLGARVGRLKAEQDALSQTLSPAEKSQWKSFQRSLSEQGD